MAGWRAGDIAECILDCNYRHPACKLAAQVPSIYYALAPRPGDRFVVESARTVDLPSGYEEKCATYLTLRGMPSNLEYHSMAFRKVMPSPELIAEERRERMPV